MSRGRWVLAARRLIRAIDRGQQVFVNSGWELENSKLGALMRAAGYQQVGADPQVSFGGRLPWFGHLEEVEQRIAALAEKRAQAQAALEAALLSDDERAKRDAAAKARLDALNALPTRKVRGDGSMYDRYPDGRRVEVTG